LRLTSDRVQFEKDRKESETENLKSELSLLRSQVSPHFMFNVLNNMVALARKKSDLLEPSLIKLSRLLRYMLYETNESSVLLEREVEYLQSYIDLQKQRFGNYITIHTSFDVTDTGSMIEPMLLIPFVENAFKHGSGIKDAFIFISLTQQESILTFKVQNRYENNPHNPKDNTSGIGLSNVKRRLSLLYQNNHNLNLHTGDGLFTVCLTINLH
jgi:LytS/YehU family sensor histidine kinase